MPTKQLTAAEQQARDLAELESLVKYMWDCGVSGCDGEPHLWNGIPIGKHARAQQLAPPGDWFIHLVLAGRGWGKSLSGAHWLANQAWQNPGTEWCIIAPKFADARSTCVEGPTGLLAVTPPEWIQPTATGSPYNKSENVIRFTNGSVIYIYGAEDATMGPRGKNLSGAWVDELAYFRNPQVWTESLMPALRTGDPRVFVTTTPRPTPLVKELVARTDGSVHVTRGSTFDNEKNLAPSFLAEMHARYDGTRIGRQELYGELLLDTPGALWTLDMFDTDGFRVPEPAEFDRIVVAIDPAVTSNEKSDETGIVVCGRKDGEFYVLADYSGKFTAEQWAQRAIDAYEAHKADLIVGEQNNGGDLIEGVIRRFGQHVAYKKVIASRGKVIRAEPVSMLYEQGKVHHVAGADLTALEDQMVGFSPAIKRQSSPDRMDALVWALTELSGRRHRTRMRFSSPYATPVPKQYTIQEQP